MDSVPAHIRHASHRFADVLAHTDPETPVPTCAPWTAADLLWHLTEVHEFWSSILAEGAETDDEVGAISDARVPRPDGADAIDEILRRREAGTSSLIAELESRRDDEPIWTWFRPDMSVGFVRRMQTHEATVHRVDAELTAGLPVTVPDPEVAADGIDHCARIMWGSGFEIVPDHVRVQELAVVRFRPDAGAPVTVRIDRWSGTRPRDGAEFDYQVSDSVADDGAVDGSLPRAEITGPAAALYLWAWGRGVALEHLGSDGEAIEITGDEPARQVVRDMVEQGID